MLSKAHLTSHSRMSGSRSVIIPSDYLVPEDLFCIVLLCILTTSSQYLLFLLGPYHFCPLSSPSLHEPAAAAAKSLQSCPTLCDPIDSSPPGSPVPGVLQARTLAWVAISFSSAWKWKWSRSVVSNSLRPHGLQPTRLLRPWEIPGKSTGVGCHCMSLVEYKLTGDWLVGGIRFRVNQIKNCEHDFKKSLILASLCWTLQLFLS